MDIWCVLIKRLVMRKILFFISLIGTIIFFILILIFVPSWNELSQMEEEQALQEEYAGIVVDNFIDRLNHEHKTTEIKTDTGVIKILHISDVSGLFDYLMVGDSIWKYKNSLTVNVKRNDQIKLFEIDIPRKE